MPWWIVVINIAVVLATFVTAFAGGFIGARSYLRQLDLRLAAAEAEVVRLKTELANRG